MSTHPAPTRHDDAAHRLAEAGDAVRAERRANSRALLLTCKSVAQAAGPDTVSPDTAGSATTATNPSPAERGDTRGDTAVHALSVTRFARLDWTWEGARAFAHSDDHDPDAPESPARPPAWAGEVVEVDPVHNRVFVATDRGAPAPTQGAFVIQPFDYLEALDTLYSSALSSLTEAPLARRLQRTAERTADDACPAPRGTASLAGVWDHPLGAVWGPPGTGKTYTLGEQVAEALRDPGERILVVSTTNKATDQAALAIASALRRRGIEPAPLLLRRVGAAVDARRLEAEGLAHLIDQGPRELRDEIAETLAAHRAATDPDRRALLWNDLQQLRVRLRGGQRLDQVPARVIVATAFAATLAAASRSMLERLTLAGTAPFRTVLIDEAGLISRAGAAALALWADRRTILYGDPHQLSPISAVARVMKTSRARWIARSALETLTTGDEPGVRLLTAQHRMHADVRHAVSQFAYEGRLTDGDTVTQRGAGSLPPELAAGPRAIWYVLDADRPAHALLRADRGPGGRSWVRPHSQSVLQRLFRAHPQLARCSGLFVSPFAAQARAIQAWLAAHGHDTHWAASTTHAQQGAEADVVVFDTVHAGSTSWNHAEWCRLVNVGLSRARQMVLLLASRLEMSEPFLVPLRNTLQARVLRGRGGRLQWEDVDLGLPAPPPGRLIEERSAETLGAQIASRKPMRPVLGREQERLCRLPFDGKPRLVRGVAGSGKTLVMAHWLARCVAGREVQGPIWVLFANASMANNIKTQVAVAWQQVQREARVQDPLPFPWQRVEMLHVLELLQQLEQEHGWQNTWGDDPYDLQGRARRLLGVGIEPRCDAMFVDEAQDFGDTTLALCARLVAPPDPAQPGQRPLHIFYDNAQNVYGRGTPKWVDLGLDMQGRSTVMKESFRSTLPITEFALNVLHRIEPRDQDPEHTELVKLDLVHHETRDGRPWWNVRFNEIEGPLPDYARFADRDAELDALAARLTTWIRDEGVQPADIAVLVNGRELRHLVTTRLDRALHPLHVRIEDRSSQSMTREAPNVLLVSTAHSYKGHEAEIVAVPCADAFTATRSGSRIPLPKPLYVALTRARSLLYVSATTPSTTNPQSALVTQALQTTSDDQHTVPDQLPACTPRETELDLLCTIAPEHQPWLRALLARGQPRVAPLLNPDRSILAEPLCLINIDGSDHACFIDPPSSRLRQRLMERGVRIELAPASGGGRGREDRR